MAHQLLVFKLIERKAIAFLHIVVVVLDVGDGSLRHLQLYVVGGRILPFVLIHGFEILLDDGSMGDDERAEIEGKG